MHHDEPTATAGSLAAVAVHLQLGEALPRVAADGGRRADPAGRVVLRVHVPAGNDDGQRAVGARLTITGSPAALRALLAAMAAEVGRVDPTPDAAVSPLLTKPHDWPR
jgi:hypothetical protein